MIYTPVLRAILRPPAELYGGMMRLRAELYRRGVLRAERLPGKTISVGNLTLGGTGKTPVTIWLARQFQALPKAGEAAGYRPGILARGYGRRDEHELVILGPAPNHYDSGRAPNQYGSGRGEGADLRTASIGDEALLIRRHLPEVPIGLCADRVRAAKALAAECGVNLFVLDDGYQRLDVARDVNLLLVDASDPACSAARDGVVPFGRLREPESATARADLVLLTRCEEIHRREPELWERLRRFTTAPIFHARTRSVGFLRASDAQMVPEEEIRRGRWLAFCGIGNPAAFFADLRRWGLEITQAIAFRDHHRYSPDDLAYLGKEAERAGATALITTEKDFINLAPISQREGRALPLYYCRTVMEPVEPEFWQEILRRLEEAG